MKKRRITPKMPPNPLPHVFARLVEIGLTEAAGDRVVPLSWREINEWQHATAVELSPWEARLIKRLSTVYVHESRRAESETCPPPWSAEVSRHEIVAEKAVLDSVLG
jgi:hypothetical protein